MQNDKVLSVRCIGLNAAAITKISILVSRLHPYKFTFIIYSRRPTSQPFKPDKSIALNGSRNGISHRPNSAKSTSIVALIHYAYHF